MSLILSNLTVSEFLLDFGAVSAVLAGLVALWREMLRITRGGVLPSLDRYETAWLAGGRPAAIELAIQSLLLRNGLVFNKSDQTFTAFPVSFSWRNAFEGQIHEILLHHDSLTADQLQIALARLTTPARLVEERLIFSRARRVMCVAPALLILPTILYVGSHEIAQLVVRSQPLTPTVLTMFAGVFAVLFASRPPLRTRHGDAVLAQSGKDESLTGVGTRALTR